MATVCKWMFISITGLLALLGATLCAMIAWSVYQFVTTPNTRGCCGEECRKSIAASLLPLPAQEETAHLPMALDDLAPCDYSGFVLIRASATWQEDFRRLFPRKPAAAIYDAYDAACSNAAQLSDKRILHFITGRKWELFHEGCIRPGKRSVDATALRDTSGEYLLIYFCDF